MRLRSCSRLLPVVPLLHAHVWMSIECVSLHGHSCSPARGLSLSFPIAVACAWVEIGVGDTGCLERGCIVGHSCSPHPHRELARFHRGSSALAFSGVLDCPLATPCLWSVVSSTETLLQRSVTWWVKPDTTHVTHTQPCTLSIPPPFQPHTPHHAQTATTLATSNSTTCIRPR